MRNGKLARFWLSLHRDNKRIAGAALWLLALTGLAKSAALGKEIAVAYQFGRGPEVDAFNLAFTLAMWLPLALYSVVAAVCVPELVRRRAEVSLASQQLSSELNFLGLVTAIVLGIFTYACAEDLAQWFAGHLLEGTRKSVAYLLRWFSLLSGLAVIASVLAVRLQARNDHRYAFAEGLVPLAIAAGVVAWSGFGLDSLLWGALIGVGCQVLWLGVIDVTKPDGSTRLAIPQWHGRWQKLARSMLILGIGSFAMSIATPLDHYLAARLGPGEVAAYGYATRALAIGMTLAAMVVSRSMLSIFSESSSRGNAAETRRRALRWAAVLLIAGIICAAIIVLLSDQIVALMYQRGSFTADDAAQVSRALVWGGWQLPFYLGGLVLISFMASQSRFMAISAIGVLGMVIKAIFNMVLISHMGLSGLFLASALMYAATSGACYLYVTYKTNAA